MALPLALGSLPGFELGYWDKAELLPIWLHAVAGVGTLGLLLAILGGSGRAHSALCHPLTLMSFLLAGWSVLALPFIARPVLSLAGTVQSGFGILWYADLAILTACALACRDERRIWQGLLWFGIAVALAISAIKVHDWMTEPRHLLIYVSSYYGFIGTGLLAAAVLPAPRSGWRAWTLPVAIMLAAFIVTIFARNTTSRAFLLGGILFMLLAHFCPPRIAFVPWLTRSRSAGLVIVAAAAILPYVLLRWAPGLENFENLRDRRLLQTVMHAALAAQDGVSWLFGNGWGLAQDALQTNFNVTGENLWRPTWVYLNADYFHPHNWILESLYAVGLPGALLVFLGFLAIPWFAAPERRPAAIVLGAALAGISSLWFFLAVSIPFVAMGLAAVADDRPRPARRSIPMAVALALLAATQFAFAVLQFDHSHQILRFRLGTQTTLPDDFRGSDIIASSVIRDGMLDMADGKIARDEGLPKARAFFAYVRAHVSTSRDTHFLVTTSNAFAQIYSTGQLGWLAPELPDGMMLWRTAIDRLLAIAPERTDAVIPYLTTKAVAGDLAETARIVARIRIRAPGDPVGLYFGGLLLVLDPAPDKKRRGIDLIRQSAAAGIERFMPLDESVKKLLGSR